MESLKKILSLLKKNYKRITVPLPLYWTYPEIAFSGEKKRVNIYNLMINYFEDYLLKPHHYQITYKFNQSVIYSAFIRATTAYDFDQDGKLKLRNKYGLRETGTLLRMLLLLPLLKRMGVNILYLLPITKSSETYRKGEAPAPYSVKSFFKLDDQIYDPMLGEYSEKKNELLFKGLVEACHKLGIRVVLDFIPRTAARDSDLIVEHPDWFYWIEKKHEKDFHPPAIEKIGSVSYEKKYAPKIYGSKGIKEYLKKFVPSPDKIDLKKWQDTVKIIKRRKKENFLSIIEKEFGITTVPGFSDVINDPQPLWTEVTFLRLYRDAPEEAKKYIEKRQPPYVLFDVIKASKSEAKRLNRELWNLLASILPYWQKNYKIDGVRIDMAHALPKRLEQEIIGNALKKDKHFILIAEEMNIKNSLEAKQSRYNAIVGNLLIDESRWQEKLKKVICNDLSGVKLPVLATAETHDTPRAVTRPGKERFYYFAAVLNYFLPNSIPFINTGFELAEKQPMNKGLDSEYTDLYQLSKKDLNYGKMALFEYTCFHWHSNNRKIIELMAYCSKVLIAYPQLKKNNNFKFLNIKNDYVCAYIISANKENFLFIVNTHMNKDYKVVFSLNKVPVQFYGVLSSYQYYKENTFFHYRVYQRIKHRGRQVQVKIKRSEIIILRY